MSTVSYDVNVRLISYERKKETSSTKSIEGKKGNTGTSKGVGRGFSYSSSAKGAKKSMKALPAVAVALAAMGIATKVANTTNRAIGTITNNRYREQRIADTISFVTNPAGGIVNTMKYGINRHFDVMRENQRIDYNRELSGNALPYLSKSGGLTF